MVSELPQPFNRYVLQPLPNIEPHKLRYELWDDFSNILFSNDQNYDLTFIAHAFGIKIQCLEP